MRQDIGSFDCGDEEGAGFERGERAEESAQEVNCDGSCLGVNLRGFGVGLLEVPGKLRGIEEGWRRVEEKKRR